MLYFARFGLRQGDDGLQHEPSPIIVDIDVEKEDEAALGLTRATEVIEEETGMRPSTLQRLPAGVLFVEVKFADETREEEGTENPANLSESGVVLEPFDLFAELLEALDDQPMPSALATTEPPAEVADGE